MHNIIAAAIEIVFTRNLSLKAILGAEYIIPMATNEKDIRRLMALAVTADRAIPRALVPIMNIHPCNFDTSPDGIGLFFPLALSKSASIRSLKTYIPIIMNKELSGSVTRLNIVWLSSCGEFIIDAKAPGIVNIPASVASA